MDQDNNSKVLFDCFGVGVCFQVPAAWLTLFNQLFLIGAIPILTTFLYPVMDRAGIRLSMLFRIGKVEYR